jgi:hypothetical protein
MPRITVTAALDAYVNDDDSDARAYETARAALKRLYVRRRRDATARRFAVLCRLYLTFDLGHGRWRRRYERLGTAAIAVDADVYVYYNGNSFSDVALPVVAYLEGLAAAAATTTTRSPPVVAVVPTLQGIPPALLATRLFVLFGGNTLMRDQPDVALPAHYVAFQLEHCTYTHWFTEPYRRLLQRAACVVDFSEQNRRTLATWGIGNVVVVPVAWTAASPLAAVRRLLTAQLHASDGGLDTAAVDVSDVRLDPDDQRLLDRSARTKGYVLFIGGSYKRRKRLLADLERRLQPDGLDVLWVKKDCYGPLRATLIRRAAVVLNLHALDGALLEEARLVPSLALGGDKIVSETSADPDADRAFADVVRFARQGSASSVARACRDVVARRRHPDRVRRFLMRRRLDATLPADLADIFRRHLG